MAAANEAAAAGARVILIDEYLRLGGQFFKQVPSAFAVKNVAFLGEEYGRGQELIRLVSEGKVDIWLDSLVWGAFSERRLGVIRGGRSIDLHAEKVIIATGAYDRPIPFPGWTLPGVITAGAAQTLAKSQWVVPGDRILLVGAGPFQLPVAQQLIKSGARVVAVVEAVSLPKLLLGSLNALGRPDRILEALGYWLAIRRSGADLVFGHTISQAVGEHEVRGAVLAAIDDDWRAKPGTERRLEVDTICLAFGFLPSTQATRLFGCAERFDALTGGFLPKHDENMETSVPGVFVAGESAGIGGADVALGEGRLAAIEAVRQLGYLDDDRARARASAFRRDLRRARRFADYINRTFAPKPAVFERIPDDTLVCRCEEVTAGEVRQAISQGADSAKSIKMMTRAGMGLCQGRVCGSTIAQLASLTAAKPAEQFGSFSPRPPIKPVRLTDLASCIGS